MNDAVSFIKCIAKCGFTPKYEFTMVAKRKLANGFNVANYVNVANDFNVANCFNVANDFNVANGFNVTKCFNVANVFHVAKISCVLGTKQALQRL